MSRDNTRLVTRILMLLWATVFPCVQVVRCAADDTGRGNMVSDWQSRADRARDLALRSDKDSFADLLELLLDEHGDVSYAAARAIETRAQVEYSTLLIKAVQQMSQDRRWYAYRSLAEYPSKMTLVFLAGSLKEEFQQLSRDRPFDSRNYYYISRSINSIVEYIERLQSSNAYKSENSEEVKAE